MDKDIVIKVDNIKKNFKIYYDKNKTLKDFLATPGRGHEKKREVLKGITFQVKRGEALAFIGKNGCGKSTMLKLLTKIIYPDSGTIQVKGKVSSLLELGAGFHPDMSGRENIYLNASVFGLTKKEIDKKVGEIIRFSELEKFIDNPVRTYSTGMYMRLAFSVAINVKAEILLIDEILGVGDVSFQKKCFSKLREIKAEGATIVIVSHAMDQIEKICDRSIWICDGVIKEDGDPKIVGEHYYREMEAERLRHMEEEHFEERKQKAAEKEKEKAEGKEEGKEKGEDGESSAAKLPDFCSKDAVRTGGQKAWLSWVGLYRQNAEEALVFSSGEDIDVQMRIGSAQQGSMTNITISVTDSNHVLCYATNYNSENHCLLELKEDNRISFCFKNLTLLGGKYYISIGIYSKEGEVLDKIKFVKEFFVQSEYDSRESGLFHMDHIWKVDEA